MNIERWLFVLCLVLSGRLASMSWLVRDAVMPAQLYLKAEGDSWN